MNGSQRDVFTVFQEITELNRTEQLLAEENQLLKLNVSDHPREECLVVLTETVSRLCPTARAAVLIMDPECKSIAECISAHVPPSFSQVLRSTAIDSTAIFTAQPVIWPDIGNSNGWSHSWRELCLEQDVHACYSTPIIADGNVIALFFLCFGEARDLNAWEHRIAEFGADIAGIVIERDKAAQLLRETEARLAQELADSEQLQKISAALIEAGGINMLYQQILDAAVTVMHSEMASMQMLHPERNELELLAYKGFHPESAAFWRWVQVDSGSTCGAALRTGERVIVEDVETCDFMAGTADLDAYRKSGIRAVQSTRLISRSGRVLGMICNHWRRPHLPSARDWRLLGILTRQAADLIERNETEEKLRESEQKQQAEDKTICLAKSSDGCGNLSVTVKASYRRNRREHSRNISVGEQRSADSEDR